MPSADRYDSLAHRYDRAHSRWLRHGGGQAQAALEGALAICLKPGLRVLDAGCGRGALGRRILGELCPEARLTLIDASPAMLQAATDLPARRFLGGMERMPFPDESFDIVIAAWAIEATDAPECALGELFRVLAPGGTLLLTFCADGGPGTLVTRVLKRAIEARGLGRFLAPDRVAECLTGLGPVTLRPLARDGAAVALAARKLEPPALAA